MSRQVSILIVDDEEVVRLSFLRILADASDDVQTANSGDEAIRMMQERPFDVVLLDLRMPGMDGIAALEIIKERWPQCEVVIITGYASLDTAKDAVRMGAHDYLQKPVGPDEVVRVAAAAITHKRWSLRRGPTLA